MLVPLSWLKAYVDLDLPVDKLADRLSMAGMEVEEIKREGDWWDPATILVGQVRSVKQHPNADRLTLVEIDYGAGVEQVVTGAPNLFVYKDAERLPILKVAFARNGAVLIDAHSEESPRPKKKLKGSKIRGIPSDGMVCSERELGLSDEHEGILILPEDAPVGMPLRDYLGNEVFELGLTPDMARCLSMIGVAREVSALTGAPLHLPPDDDESGDAVGEAEQYVDVEIANPELCNRYVALIIEDVQIGPSPKWMQERLTLAGMRPINNIVDITNYVMLEWGQPLHAFDYDLLKARARQAGQEKPVIRVRTALPAEKMRTLDGVERELDESMLMITDVQGSVAIAGIMGGAETEVHEHSRCILLEAATFENINNRRTAQKLKLHSEASQRFSRGVPATLCLIAAKRAARLMRDYAGGTVVSGRVDNYPVPQRERVVYTTASNVRRLLGMEASLETIAQNLQRLEIVSEVLPALPAPREALGDAALGLRIEPNEAVLRCVAPWHRLDIQYPADLSEEVARIIGYEDIATTLMNDVPPAHVNDTLRTEEQMRDILTACGLMETINYALTTPENHDKLRREEIGSAERNEQFITLLNPLSVNRRVMRRSLLVSALENAAYNYRYSQRLATFEIGRVYLPEQGKGKLPLEERRLSMLLTGSRRPASVHPDPAGAEPFDFFDVKGVLETLFARLGVASGEIDYVARSGDPRFAAAAAEIRLRGSVLGVLGEIHPLVLQAYDLPTSARVYVADLAIEPLVRPGWRLQAMKPISNYPSVIEDLAFVVREEVTSGEIQAAMRKAGGNLLTRIELFDIYRGQPVPQGHKSMAYQLTYESQEGNLTDSRVQDLRNRIIRRVSDSVGASLRE
jgi:phenylalanyl-tRNA synthetase beta chain